MDQAKKPGRRGRLTGYRKLTFLLALAALAGTVPCAICAQGASARPADAAPDDDEGRAPVLSMTASPEERSTQAWAMLTNAATDAKHIQTRIQALAALGMMSGSRSERMLADAMTDTNLDVRTAAALAAGQSKDRNLTTNLRVLLDDKEPQVAFTAATTLWKMDDRSGEDILMAVVDGERRAGATLINGTEHDISNELHDPTAMAKLGALQGASMLLGPFGFGITAFEYIRKNGGDSARVSAIELIGQEKTEPIHKDLLAALTDKDPTVRAAAAKSLVDYRDRETSMAIYKLLGDPKQPVRLTAAAAYLRIAGAPGPPPHLATVLSQMDAASAKFTSAQADVRQLIFTKVVQDTSTETGEIYFLRKGSATEMGMKMSAPNAPAGSPPAEIVDFKDGTLREYNPGINHIDTQTTSGHQAMAETFLTLGFGGSGRDLDRSWTIDDQGTDEMSDGSKTIAVEKLDLTPKDADLRKNITHITIWVDPIRAVSLKQVFYFPKGDTRTTFYTNIRLNQKVDQSAFAIKCKNNKCS
jgi:outer membrane lipoprotein-sorting protein